MDTKICNRCKAEKLLTEFQTRKNGKPDSYCQPCYKIIKHEAYERQKERGYVPPMSTEKCSAADCENMAEAKSFCGKHYSRWNKYGDVNIVKVGKPPPGSRKYNSAPGTKEYYNEQYAANKEERSRRSAIRQLKKRAKEFGVEWEEYEKLLEEGCKICGQEQNGRRLSMDHIHETGKFRGVLCSNCNVALGLLGEDVDRMKAMIKYVEDGG